MDLDQFIPEVKKYFEFLIRDFSYKIYLVHESSLIHSILFTNTQSQRGVYFEYQYDGLFKMVIVQYRTSQISLETIEDEVKFIELLKELGVNAENVHAQYDYSKTLKHCAYYMVTYCSSIINGSEWVQVEKKKPAIRKNKYSLKNPTTGEWERYDTLEELNKRLKEL